MADTTTKSPLLRRGVQALAVASLLTFASCGGSGGGTEAGDSATETTKRKATGDSDEPTTTGGPVKTAEPVALIPVGGKAPSGFRLGEARCDADPDAEDDDVRRTWIVYGVPEAWQNVSAGSGGSGGPQDNETLGFTTDGDSGSKGRVEVDIKWDNRSAEGTLVDSDGEPFENFDYEIDYLGDDARTINIAYDKAGTVDVGDQSVELFYRDPTQNTEELKTQGQYKARVVAYKLPDSQSNLEKLVESSFVVTIDFDTEDSPLTQEIAAEILGSVAMPECTWEQVLADGELMLGVDLDGDGHVRNADDVKEDLSENMDDMMDKMAPEQRKQFEEMREKLEEQTD